MKGVFVNDSGVFNAAGDYWVGCVPVKNLKDSKDVQQVKAGDKGKHGVTNPITGEFQQETEAIYVWRRKNGDLEVISGRHKFALALETDTPSVLCYVFNEDAKHDAKWARLLDFENNMRSDQADELTCGIYVRETGYDDATLRKKGLMRNKSRSKRGILIGRAARGELWGRFKSGTVKPKDAEMICLMTKDIADESRIDAIQRECCELLEQRKSWEYISAMVQLMASEENVQISQGLFDFGADFHEQMERTALFVEKNIHALNDAISVMKQGRKLATTKKDLAERLGTATTTREGSGKLLQDLIELKARYENFGLYPELTEAARLWDGKNEPDPIAQAMGLTDAETERLAAEAGMSREEWEEAQRVAEAKREAEKATGSLFGDGGSFSIATESAQRVEPTPKEAFTRMDVDGPGMSSAEYGKLSKEERKEKNDQYALLSQDEKEKLAAPGLNAVYAKAAEAQEDFRKIVEGVGAKLGLKVMMRTGLKGRERAMQKTTTDNKGDAGQLLDVYGGTLILTKDDDFAAAVEELRRSGVKIARIKNGYQDQNPYGYADIKVNLEMPNGFIGEVILIEDVMNEQKFGIGHKIYEAGRDIQSELDDNEKNPDYDPERRKLATELVEALQRWSTACYTRQPQEVLKTRIEETLEAHQRGLAYILHSSREDNGQAALATEGEWINSEGSSQREESSPSSKIWKISPERLIPQAPSWSPLVQNLIKSASSALNIENSIDTGGRNVNQENTGSASFSVIGPRAKTFSKYVDKAFLGRDDGKMRAEIDASQARLKGAWTDPGDLDRLAYRLATPDEKKKLDELRKVQKEWDEVFLDDEKAKEADALEKREGELKKELEGLTDRILDELGYHLQSAQPAVRDKARRLASKGDLSGLRNDIDINPNKKDRMKLGDILDYPELFEAYPELAKMEVRESDLGKGSRGGYNNLWWRSITMNKALGAEERRSTLLHEIQHAIQHIEGFAKGSNAAAAGSKAQRIQWEREKLKEYRWELKQTEAYPEEMKDMDRSALKGARDKLLADYTALGAEHLRKMKKERRSLTDEERKKQAELWDSYRDYDSLLSMVESKGKKNAREVIEELKKEIKQTQKQLREVHGVRQSLSDYELYRRTAGEIESRNVEERRDWTAEQRQATPFNDTLEYPGEAVNFGSFSVTEAKEKKLFDEHGIMQAANGVLIDGTSFAITAMHASPHGFLKFLLDKIGTGEGNQAYGHGMYFTESEGVNDNYLQAFKEDETYWLVNGKKTSGKNAHSLIPGVSEGAVNYLLRNFNIGASTLENVRRMVDLYEFFVEQGKGTISDLEEEIRKENAVTTIDEDEEYIRRYRREKLASWSEKLKHDERLLRGTKELEAWLKAGNTLERKRESTPAYNYRVEIDAEDYELLHWDDKMDDESNAGALKLMLKSPVEEVRKLAETIGANTGEKFYWKLTEQMRQKHGLGNSRSEKALAAKYASEALLASGIKGHKYADGVTRHKAKSEWKYNYVIWDENALKITHVARGNRDWKPAPLEEEEEYHGSFSIAGERVPREEAVRIAREFGALSESEGVRVEAPEVYAEDGKEARAFAREVYRKLQEETAGGKLLEMPDGRRAKVSRRGLSEVQHHSADRRVLAALCSLRDLCRQSIYINSAANTQPEKKRKEGIVRFHYYIAKGNFVGASAVNERAQDEAYVNIVLSEYENGDLFYDLDATKVEDVNKNEGVSATLPGARLPRAGEQKGEAPYVGRIQQTKQFVNYVNKKIKEEDSGSHGSFSVAEAKEKKLFDENGIMQAANGVLIDGTSFAITAMHASPHWIQDKFRLDKMGSGEGAQMFGAGMYFTESPGVNNHYLRQFADETPDRWFVNGKEVSSFAEAEKIIPGLEESGLRDWLSEVKDNRDFLEQLKEMERGVTDGFKFKIDELKSAIELYEDKLKGSPLWELTPADRQETEQYLKEYREDLKIREKVYQKLLEPYKKIREWIKAGNTIRSESGAYNYRVEIDMEEGEFFYWDIAMSDKENAGAWERMLNSPVEEVREVAEDIKYGEFEGAIPGEVLYTNLTERMRDEYGLGYSREDDAQAQKYASEALLASGIKGHKYADGFTRGMEKSEWIYNEVVYDMDAIRITHVARGNRDWKPYAPREEEPGGASMSVIGPRAKTFSKYVDKAFLGRDDGKMRAEIDASQARLKGAWTAPEDLGRLATPGEKKKLDELRHAWDEWQKLAHSRKPEELAEKQALQKQAAKLGKELEGFADRMLKELGYHLQSAQPGVRDKARRRVLLGDMDGLINDIDLSIYKKDKRKLSEVLDYPELFDAYPELAEMEVRDSYLGKGTYGGYDNLWTRSITINEALTPEERRSTLLHEIQHAIQDIEGFAKGSNAAAAGSKAQRIQWARQKLKDYRWELKQTEAYPEEMKDMDRSALEEARDKLLADYTALGAEHLRKMKKERRSLTDEERKKKDELWMSYRDYDSLLSMVESKGKKNAREVIEELKKEIKQTQAQLREVHGVRQSLSDYELYRRTAGEIESRNVQERRDWTAEQRQATPFNDTLEYPGEAVNFGSFSVAEAKEKKLFDENGIMQAANGVLIDGTSFSFVAMHASPHWFLKFLIDKMGTGEGLQMFGAGMYFAESDRVNDKYLRQFERRSGKSWLVNGKEVSEKDLKKLIPGYATLSGCGYIPDYLLKPFGYDHRGLLMTVEDIEETIKSEKKISLLQYSTAAKEYERRFKNGPSLFEENPEAWWKETEDNLEYYRKELKKQEETFQKHLDAVKKLREWVEAGNTFGMNTKKAYNYRVEIDAEDSELLWWDDKMGDKSNAGALELMRKSPVEEVRKLAEHAYMNLDIEPPEPHTGESIYKKLTLLMAKKHGLNIHDTKDQALAQKYASEALLASGIKGHKYADGFTRGKAKRWRKYNSVIWDMDSLKITHVARGNRDWKPAPQEEEGGFSASLVDMARDARFMLRRREDDIEGEELVERWDWMLARLETASTESGSRRDGSARMGAITALLEATRSVLPPKYAKLGRLNMLMKWAAVYAHMVSTGEVKRDGALKGPVFEKFAAAMMEKSAAWREDGLLEGMTEEEAKDALRQLGEVRLDEALLKVAKECRARLDKFVKARARERIELTAERTWPKKERGRKSPRGKMEAARYRGMNAMLAWMDADADEVSRRQDEIRARLDKLEGEEPLDEDKAAEKAALEEEMRIIQLFGDWEGMTAQQARIAADDFNEYVLTGRHKWEEKIERERRRREWEKMNMDFSEESDANTRSAQKREGGLKNIVKHGIKTFATNTMSYSQLMLAAKRVFGERFTRERVQEIADANAALRRARRDRDDAFARALMKATGLTGKAELTDWLNRFGKEEKHTGIILRQVTNRTLEMTRDEARAWVGMTAGERERKRQELREEAERERLSAPNIPEERDMDKLREELARLDSKKSRAAKVKIKVPRRGKAIELTASRDAVANALLLLEQEDYQHLIEYEGLEPRDAQGNVIDREKDTETPIDIDQTLKPLRDFVGEDGVRFVRALQEYVGKNGREMQKVYEDRQGVPFPMKRGYWRGNFNINTVKEKDTLTEQNGMMGGGGYAFLIDRVKHYNRLEWTNTATMVFGVTVEQQNNYEPRTAQSVFIALRT